MLLALMSAGPGRLWPDLIRFKPPAGADLGIGFPKTPIRPIEYPLD
jgi:hypothetical protein